MWIWPARQGHGFDAEAARRVQRGPAGRHQGAAWSFPNGFDPETRSPAARSGSGRLLPSLDRHGTCPLIGPRCPTLHIPTAGGVSAARLPGTPGLQAPGRMQPPPRNLWGRPIRAIEMADCRTDEPSPWDMAAVPAHCRSRKSRRLGLAISQGPCPGCTASGARGYDKSRKFDRSIAGLRSRQPSPDPRHASRPGYRMDGAAGGEGFTLSLLVAQGREASKPAASTRAGSDRSAGGMGTCFHAGPEPGAGRSEAPRSL